MSNTREVKATNYYNTKGATGILSTTDVYFEVCMNTTCYRVLMGVHHKTPTNKFRFDRRDGIWFLMPQYPAVLGWRDKKNSIPLSCTCPDFVYRCPWLLTGFMYDVLNKYVDAEQRVSDINCIVECKHMIYARLCLQTLQRRQ